MHLSKGRAIIAGILILTFAIAIVAYPYLPDRLASHWGVSGEVNGYLPKIWGLFIVPVISAALTLLFLLIPRIDPLGKNIAKFMDAYEQFVVIILAFLFYVSLLTILWNTGMRFSIGQVLSPAFAVLFYACGILIGKAKRNWFIGIRTPWTLSSDRAWDKTHAIGGKLFRIAGVLALGGILLPGIAWLFLLGPILLISGYLVVYSYLEYRREEEERKPSDGT
ncbi:MAG: SdpI family protein [Methanomicrobiales archaeon]|jgi:uncharacterized membrane protein